MDVETDPAMALAGATEALRAGRPIVVVTPDVHRGAVTSGRVRRDNTRIGRGAMVAVAAMASAAMVNTLVTWGRGLICFSVTAEQAMSLGLGLSAALRDDASGPIFLRSVEAAACDGTGISAEDRAMTLRAAGAADAGPGSLKSPGHVIPAIALYAEQPGIADIALHALGSLASHAIPAWTDILDDSGEVADAAYCRALAARLGLVCIEAAELSGGSA